MKPKSNWFNTLIILFIVLLATACAPDDEDEGDASGDSGGTGAPQLIGEGMIGTALNLTDSSLVEVLTGDGVNDSIDGDGTAASHGAPHDVCSDGDYLYVVDKSSHKIRKISLESPFTVSTLAGAGTPGSTDGSSDTAEFNNPAGITTDGIYLYIADQQNQLIRKVRISDGYVETLAGSAGTSGSADGSSDDARFLAPTGITFAGDKLYVADMGNGMIREVDRETGYVTTIAGGGTGTGGTGVTCTGPNATDCVNGTGLDADFGVVHDLTTNGTYIFVIDQSSYRIRMVEISTGIVTTLTGSGTIASVDGSSDVASLNEPEGITNDGTHLYFTDWGDSTSDFGASVIRKVRISDGNTETIAGGGAAGTDCTGSNISNCKNGTGLNARFNWAHDLATDGEALYLADFNNDRIRKIYNSE